MSLSQNEQAINWIKRSNKILLATENPFSSDGVCALLGLKILLTRMGKKVVSVKPNHIKNNFTFLPGAKEIQHDLETKGEYIISIPKGSGNIEKVNYDIENNRTRIKVKTDGSLLSEKEIELLPAPADFDLIITLDTPNLETLGQVFAHNTAFFTSTPIINISADPANEHYGKLNLVDLSKSSTCEIIYELAAATPTLAPHIGKQVATSLLTGVIATTNSFQKQNTSTSALSTAGALQKAGADHSEIIERLFKMKSLPILKIWGIILEKLQLDVPHRIAYASVTQQELESSDATIADIEDLANQLLRHIKGADLVALFIEQDDDILLQIRIPSTGSLKPQLIQPVLKGKEVLNGLDITLSGPEAHSPEKEVLKKLKDLQIAQNRIGEEAPSEKIDPKTSSEKTTPEEKASPTPAPKAPTKVPFVVEKRADETPTRQ